MTFQDESAAREQGTSQGVRKEAEKLKVHLPFRIDSFESELRGFSAFYQLDVLMCDGKAGKCFLFVNRVVAAAIFKVCWALAAWERPFNKGLQAIDRG